MVSDDDKGAKEALWGWLHNCVSVGSGNVFPRNSNARAGIRMERRRIRRNERNMKHDSLFWHGDAKEAGRTYCRECVVILCVSYEKLSASLRSGDV
ncbi:hypothetical protein CEXT_224681 [Caerostris extrusa]|uniref:Uncharacterized protein n=1 Tax=Caerostris extrusa TaxID=172846 RepID=A0AAV4XE63_CAEEX|nr:hypothetical protein CEXT_224681 [Caerostris extrusa]